MKFLVALTVFCIASLSCTNQSSENDEPLSVEPKYVLPFPVGREYICSQGFNGQSHTGTFRYAVDFAMPISTPVTAARKGRVVYLITAHSDDDQTAGHENVAIVFHEDSTYARYVHLTTHGGLVSIGQTVMPGDTIALSGNSGSSGAPHLHFDVTKTNTGRSDQTIPFDFQNTIPHPIGLQVGMSYKALPY